MQAKQRSLEAAVFRPSKARRVSESSLSAGSRAGTEALWGQLGPLALLAAPGGLSHPQPTWGAQAGSPPACPSLPPQSQLGMGRATGSFPAQQEGLCLALPPATSERYGPGRCRESGPSSLGGHRVICSSARGPRRQAWKGGHKTAFF